MTVRTYGTDEAFRVALETRVKASAAKLNHADPNRQRQLLLADRYLARLSLEFGDALLAKGGIALELRLPHARATQDLDLQVSGSSTNLVDRLIAAGRRDLGDRLRFVVSTAPGDLDTIENEGLNYEGFRFKVTASLGARTYGDRFGLDVVFGASARSEVDEVEGVDTLDFIGIAPHRHRLYPRELHLAEKLHAYTQPRPSPNGRVKDLPDIALLAQTGSFNGRHVRAAFDSVFLSRGTHPVPNSLPSPPAEFWRRNYEKMAAYNQLEWKTLDDVFNAASSFLNPLLKSDAGEWNPMSWRWSSVSART